MFLMVALTTSVMSQSNKEQLKGSKPYIPTRLDWLAVDLNSSLRVPITVESFYSLDFVALHDRDTIAIVVRYNPSADRSIMNLSIDTAKQIVGMKAKNHGWSDWLKVEENVKMHKLD